MKQSIGILVFLIVISAGAAVYGGVEGIEILLGAGVAVGFLCLVFIPVFYARAGKVKKIRERTDALIVFEYTREEEDEIVKTQRKAARKKSRSLSILFSICFLVIFGPMVAVTAQESDVQQIILGIGLASVLAPWLSLLIAPIAAESRIRRTTCTSVVGRDYILIANEYIGINDRYSLCAIETNFVPPQNGKMAILYILYRFKGGRTMREFDKWVQVPAPRGREGEAKGLVV